MKRRGACQGPEWAEHCADGRQIELQFSAPQSLLHATERRYTRAAGLMNARASSAAGPSLSLCGEADTGRFVSPSPGPSLGLLSCYPSTALTPGELTGLTELQAAVGSKPGSEPRLTSCLPPRSSG